eukprot:94701_1
MCVKLLFLIQMVGTFQPTFCSPRCMLMMDVCEIIVFNSDGRYFSTQFLFAALYVDFGAFLLFDDLFLSEILFCLVVVDGVVKSMSSSESLISILDDLPRFVEFAMMIETNYQQKKK